MSSFDSSIICNLDNPKRSNFQIMTKLFLFNSWRHAYLCSDTSPYAMGRYSCPRFLDLIKGILFWYLKNSFKNILSFKGGRIVLPSIPKGKLPKVWYSIEKLDFVTRYFEKGLSLNGIIYLETNNYSLLKST